jgi:hypothetical protein
MHRVRMKTVLFILLILLSSIPAAAQVDHFEISAISSPQTAGVQFAVTITAVDAGGAPVPTFADSVFLSALAGGDVAPTFVEGNQFVGGSWTGNVTFYRVSTVTALLVEDHAVPRHSGVSNTFEVIGTNVLSRLLLLVPGETHTPGTPVGKTGSPSGAQAGQWYSPVYVYGTDNYYNVVNTASDVVAFGSTTDPSATLPPPTAFTAGQPAALAFIDAVSFLVTGDNDLYAYDQTNGTITPDTSAPIPTAPATLDHLDITPIPSPQTTIVPFTLTVVARDQFGNAVSVPGSATLSTNAPAGTMVPTSTSFGGDTVATASMSYRFAHDTARIAATVGSITDTSNTFDVDPGPPDAVQILADGEVATPGLTPGYSGSVNNAYVGTWYPLTISLVDAWFNPVATPSQMTTFSISGTPDPDAELPPDRNLSGTVADSVRFHLGGVTQRIAADPVSPPGITGLSSPIPVLVSVFERIIVLSPTESLAPGTIIGKTSDSTAVVYSGIPFNVRIYGTDRYANPVNTNDLVFISSTDTLATFTPGPLANLSSGFLSTSADMRMEGIRQILVIDSSNSQNIIPGETWVRVIAGNYHFEVFVPDSAVAGVDDPDTFPVNVRIINNDTGNIEPITRTVEVTARQAANPSLPGNGDLHVDGGSIVTVPNGEATFEAAYNIAEPIMIHVRDIETQANALSNVCVIYPNVFTLMVPHNRTIVVLPGDTATVAVTCTDAFTNPIPNLPVTFSTEADSNARYTILTDTNTVTSPYGVASMSLRLDSSCTEVQVTAASDPLSVGTLVRTPGPPSTRLIVTDPSGQPAAWSPDSSTVYGNATSRFRLEATAEYPSLSPVDSTFYQINQNPYVLTYARPDTFIAEFYFDSVGFYQLQYYSVDSVGTAEVPETTQVVIAVPDTVRGFVNYPNPFNPADGPTSLQYFLASAADVAVEVYTLLGELVYRATYPAGQQGGQQGPNHVFWDGRNGKGHLVGSGGYIAIVSGGLDRFVRKLAVVR